MVYGELGAKDLCGAACEDLCSLLEKLTARRRLRTLTLIEVPNATSKRHSEPASRTWTAGGENAL